MPDSPTHGSRGHPEDTAENPAVPAATVILLRDHASGLETLMVRRATRIHFGGMWVFPGGRIDPDDYPVGAPGDTATAARHAAAREAAEEAGLIVDEERMVPFSHWTPPPGTGKRFATWFFVAAAPPGSVTVDGGEIHDHAWVLPAETIRRRDLGEVELAPPTWVTLHRLAEYSDAATAIADSRAREPEVFATRLARVESGMVALYAGDAGYEAAAADRAGPRHRLWMLESGWRYERSA